MEGAVVVLLEMVAVFPGPEKKSNRAKATLLPKSDTENARINYFPSVNAAMTLLP